MSRTFAVVVLGLSLVGFCAANAQSAVIASEDWEDTSGNTRDWPEADYYKPGEPRPWVVTWPQQWNVIRYGGDYPPNLTHVTDGGSTVGRVEQHNTVKAYLDGFTVLDSTQTLDLRFSTASTTGPNAGLVARFNPDDPDVEGDQTTFYQAVLLTQTGNLQIQRRVGTSTSTLATFTAGIVREVYNTMIFEIEQISETETALRAKIWARGTPQPAGWMLDIIDTHAAMQNTEGHLGLQATTSGNRRWYFDNYQATTVPEPATLAILALGGLGLLARRRRTA